MRVNKLKRRLREPIVILLEGYSSEIYEVFCERKLSIPTDVDSEESSLPSRVRAHKTTWLTSNLIRVEVK